MCQLLSIWITMGPSAIPRHLFGNNKRYHKGIRHTAHPYSLITALNYRLDALLRFSSHPVQICPAIRTAYKKATFAGPRCPFGLQLYKCSRTCKEILMDVTISSMASSRSGMDDESADLALYFLQAIGRPLTSINHYPYMCSAPSMGHHTSNCPRFCSNLSRP